MNESKFRVIKRDGTAKKYLRHEGHKHYWTTVESEAMEYTKLDVATALASQNGGEVEAQ